MNKMTREERLENGWVKKFVVRSGNGNYVSDEDLFAADHSCWAIHSKEAVKFNSKRDALNWIWSFAQWNYKNFGESRDKANLKIITRWVRKQDKLKCFKIGDEVIIRGVVKDISEFEDYGSVDVNIPAEDDIWSFNVNSLQLAKDYK